MGHLNDVLFPVKLWERWYNLSVPGQVVGQLKDGSVLGQLMGTLGNDAAERLFCRRSDR